MTDCVIICYFSTPNIAPLRQNTAKIRGQVYIIYRTFIYQKSTFLIVLNYYDTAYSFPFSYTLLNLNSYFFLLCFFFSFKASSVSLSATSFS